MKRSLVLLSLVSSLNSGAAVDVAQYFNEYRQEEEIRINIGFQDDFAFWQKGHPLYYQFGQFQGDMANKLEDYKVEIRPYRLKLMSKSPTYVRFEMGEDSLFQPQKSLKDHLYDKKLAFHLNGKAISSNSATNYFDALSLCFLKSVSKTSFPKVFEQISKQSCQDVEKLDFLATLDLKVVEKGNINPRKIFSFCNMNSTGLRKAFQKSFEQTGWVEGRVSKTELKEVCKEKFLEGVFENQKRDFLVSKKDNNFSLVNKYFEISSNSAKSLLDEFTKFIHKQEDIIQTDIPLSQMVNSKRISHLYLRNGVRDIHTLMQSTYIKEDYFRGLTSDQKHLLGLKLNRLLKESCTDSSGETLEDRLKAEEELEAKLYKNIVTNFNLVQEKKNEYEQCLLDQQSSDSDDEDEEETEEESEEESEKFRRHRNNEVKECDALSPVEENILDRGLYKPVVREVELSCLSSIDIQEFVTINLANKQYIWIGNE